MIVVLVSWWVLAAALALFGLKMWHWYDVHQDWLLAKRVAPSTPEFIQARGSMRLAWLRVVDGVLWLGLAVLVWWSGYQLQPALTATDLMVSARVVLLVMIGFEMAKILTDRITRTEVLHEVIRMHSIRVDVQKLGEKMEAQTEQQTEIIVAEVAKGTEAAHAAYKEANSVNIKIENLNKRLLADEKTDKPKER